MTESGGEAECELENSDNGNGKPSDDDDDNDCDNGNKNDVNSAKNRSVFSELDSPTGLLTKQFQKPILNTDVQISSPKMEYKSFHPRLCHRNRQNWKCGLYRHLEKHISFRSCWTHWLFYHSQVSRTFSHILGGKCQIWNSYFQIWKD